MTKKYLFALFSLPMLIFYVVFISTFFFGEKLDINVAYFLEESMRSGKSGGIAPMIVSSLLLTFLSSLIALPISLCVALFLRFSLINKKFWFNLSDMLLSVLLGIPSIVFGLFGNAFFVIYLKMGYSILSGSLTLACMILPTCSKLLFDHLKIIPNDYFLAIDSLNISYRKSLTNVIFPLTLPAIFTSFVFSISRALSETAALLFTSGYVDRMPESIMDSGRALSVHIYDLALNIPGGDHAAFKASFVFLMIAIVINLFSNLIFKSKTGNYL